MGMDVYGKNSRSEKGRYFRDSVWGWRPLAHYISQVAPSWLYGRCKHWQSNDGDGLNERDSLTLAAILRQEIGSGRTAAYQQQWQEHLDRLPLLTCDLCLGAGIRTDMIGCQSDMPGKYVTSPGPRQGALGWCNGCDGHGKVQDLETWYSFSVENVQEFAEFLEDCGGFEIR